MILGLLKRSVGTTCLLSVLVALLGVNLASAQMQVTGTVVDAEDNAPLPGVNIVEVGTTRGASTDFDGKFSFIASGPNVTLAVSFVGYVTQYIDLNGRSQLDVMLAEDVALLEEVVVTAFGIERKERAVGFSVSQVSGEDLVQAREPNVANALSGKISGVVVNNTASGVGGSSRVVIRGNTALGNNQNNQPLYVVDGVPIDNSNLGSAGMWGGTDLGDGIASINPDDIDNISVLKGAAAAALYGTRAQNGVVLISTKKGQVGSGIGVEFNSNVTFDDIVKVTDFQTEYGQGTRGAKPADQEEALDTGFSSWGARLDGSMVPQFDGVMRPYSALDNAQNAFYRTGLSATNTVALSGGFGKTQMRASLSHLTNESIVPNSDLQRTSVTLRGASELGSRLSFDGKLTYVREKVNNRSRLSDAPGNANFGIAFLPPNVDVAALRGCQSPDLCPGDEGFSEGEGYNEDGTELQHQSSTFTQNPFWAAYQFSDDDEEDRLIGFLAARYKFTDWLDVQVRGGTDAYTTRRSNLTPYGTGYSPFGQLAEQTYRIRENNFDLLATANKSLTSDFQVNASLGGNILYRRFERFELFGREMNIPYLATFSNFASQSANLQFNEKQINSIYGQAEFSYRDYLFLTATGRNDWSSTLPRDNNSYFYPSFSGSFVFSDAINVPEWLSFGKVRASWAEVGGDTDPYQLALTYQLTGQGHLGQPIGRIAQGQIPLATLKPSSQVGIEFGTDLRFVDNRVGVDFTWYKTETTDQILNTTISSASGFGSAVINAGGMTNQGIEVLLTGTPVRSADVRWDIGFNFAKNDNEVTELAGEQERLVLDQARSRNVFVVADVGEPYGTLVGTAFMRDDQGRIVYGADGFPMQAAELKILGLGTPDWSMGVTNTVRYKEFTLSALLDMRFGGDLYSGTNSGAYSRGLHKETLVGRGEGIVGDGVAFDTCTGENSDGVLTGCSANTVRIDEQDYYADLAGFAEPFVYDASYVKLRELKLSYRLPSRWFANTPIQLATISLVGRNLWLIHSNVPNVDPESQYSSTNGAQGLEWLGVPQTRSLGFNFNIRL